MMQVEEALARLTERVPRKPARDLPLHQALGRLLAEPVVSTRQVPPLDNASMDGFAVRSVDTQRPPVRLAVVATTYAGDPPAANMGPGQAVRIMTGAPMPQGGADAVVRVEDTEPGAQGAAGRQSVSIRRSVHPGQFVRQAGEDIQEGTTVLSAGAVVNPARLGLLASIGVATVPVVQRPRVAILATGDELVQLGEQPGPGQIFGSNSHALAGLVWEAGGVPVDHGAVADELDATRAALRRAAGADLLITTGGVSMGEKDWVRVALDAEGAQLDFWKVAVRPGKPAAFGRLGTTRLFCLAGNPVSCMVGFYQWVRPVLRLMLGDPRPHLPVITAHCDESIAKRPGRAWLERVVLQHQPDGGVLARRTGNQSSGVLTSMARAHGLLLLALESTGVQKGQPVRVMVLDWSFLNGTEPGYGW